MMASGGRVDHEAVRFALPMGVARPLAAEVAHVAPAARSGVDSTHVEDEEVVCGMIDEIANEQRPGFDPGNHPTFRIGSKAVWSPLGIERQQFDGLEESARLAILADREGLKRPVRERVAIRRHLRGDPSGAQVFQQFRARHSASCANLFDPAAESGHLLRVPDDLKNLEATSELLALFRRPFFHFLADFLVTHGAKAAAGVGNSQSAIAAFPLASGPPRAQPLERGTGKTIPLAFAFA